MNMGLVFDKLFRRTILLKATATGYDVTDITGNIRNGVYLEHLPNGEDKGIIIDPNYIYRVRGIRGISQICIQSYNEGSLKDLLNRGPGNDTMTESTLGGLLTMAEMAGAKKQSGGMKNDKVQVYTLLAAVAAAAASIMIYMRG